MPHEPPDFELLAPAGNWDCARAAVENGADAIYFGLETGFNARARAANFALADLPRLMHFLHLRGVRGYVTLNTLIFSDELTALLDNVVSVAQAGADAILVQDLGAARLIREYCPELELHASTQMSLTSSAGLRVAERLGLSRVVLPRELSIDEIQAISAESTVGLEAFVHGALCVAYSGQCLTSESLGGRSANRGQCAQACRLPYELVCDGRDVPLGDVKYLLSPQDLAAYALLPELIKAGVRSFKVEGRLKTPEYVANVTKHYREALDAAVRSQSWSLSPQAKDELELSFSRGFSPGWLHGCDHKMLVPGLSSAKRGIAIGRVITVRGRNVTLELTGDLKPGDGIVFQGSRLEGTEQGGRVLTVTARNTPTGRAAAKNTHLVDIQLRREDVDVDELLAGQAVWKTDDPQLTKRLKASYSGPDPHRRVDLDLLVTCRAGQPMEVVARAASGAECRVSSNDPLPVAKKHPVTQATLREQLGRLGGTVYRLGNVSCDLDGIAMAPLSILGQVRRDMIESLDESLWPSAPPLQNDAIERFQASRLVQSPSPPTAGLVLHVLCRKLEQIEPAIAAGAASIGVELMDIRQYRDAVASAHAHGIPVTLATPRIEKPGETGIFSLIEKQQPDAVLVRNLGGLDYFHGRGVPCIADFSLNATNEWTVNLLRDWGADRVTTSYDLNRDQMLHLVDRMDASCLEVVIHQHMPMFHMEHCVFCAVLSPGTNKTNCGRPCDDHQVTLRDRVGMEHPLHADVGCRNTLYNATAQSSAEIVPMLQRAGVGHFRIELLEDDAACVREIVATYQALLAGELTGREVWSRLNAMNRVGVTRGTLEERRNPLAIL